MVWAFCTPQDWNVAKVIVLVVMDLMFWAVAAIVILGKFFSRPDYVTTQGAAVWMATTPIGKQPKKVHMEEAFEHLISRLPELATDSRIQIASLEKLVRKVCVEWTGSPITILSRYGWQVKDKAGLQQGTRIMVWWKGWVKQTAFFHEMGHMVRQELLGKDIDYKHEDTEWWKTIEKLNGEFDEICG